MKKENSFEKSVEYMYGEGRLDMYNKARKKAGLPLLAQKQRQCLKCNSIFLSYSVDHRMCPECRFQIRYQNQYDDFCRD